MKNNTEIYASSNGEVRIAPSVLSAWSDARQMGADDPEAFGIMVGTVSEDESEVCIEYVTGPMSKDECSRYSFRIKDDGHQAFADDTHANSEGTHIYLGTWHTHPQDIPSPSGIDKNDWKNCMRLNPDRPLIFVIVGREETKVFKKGRFRFKALRKMDTGC